MQTKPTYQELERKIGLLEYNEENYKQKIAFLKERENELKFLIEEPKQAQNIFLKGKIAILKIENKTSWPIEYTSPNINTLLGYSKEEIAQSKITFKDIIHTQNIPFFEQVIKTISHNGNIGHQKQIEFQIITKKGDDKWLSSQIIAIKEKGDEISHFQLVISDITENKQMELALKLSEERYRLLFENSPLGIYIADRKGNILDANSALTKMMGSPSIEQTKKINILKFSPLIENGYAEEFERCIRTGKTIRQELLYTTKWGKSAYLKGHLIPIKNKKNEVERVFTIMEDITKQKEVEKTLKQSEQQLKKTNDTKDKFFSIIAHDLRSPFNTLLGFIQLLIQSFDKIDQSTQKKYIKIIEKSAKNTYNLLEDLLLWSNNQSGKIQFEPVLINLSTHFENAIEILINSANEKSIRINKNISKDVFLYADKEMLSVIVRNLITNAIKFTPKGGEINIYSKINHDEPTDPFVKITIEDNGKGMNVETLEKLFKIDQTISTKGTDGESGTGLGLVLCKEFIEKHKGTIHVESEVGKGSKFSFTIPTN